MVMLQDEESVRALIRERLISKMWWVIVPGRVTGLLSRLEEQFYSGERNEDFHLLVGSIPGSNACCVALALKKWAPP
jgi:hypothetical protein